MHDHIDPRLLDHLQGTTGLPAGRCRRLALDVLAFCNEPLEAFAQRRHRELKNELGLKNDAIYARIAEEAKQRPFAAPSLTERQVRRMIYG